MRSFVLALLLSTTSAIKLNISNQVLLEIYNQALDKPISPITFKDNKGCTHTYDHSHSVMTGSQVECPEVEEDKESSKASVKKGTKEESKVKVEKRSKKETKKAGSDDKDGEKLLKEEKKSIKSAKEADSASKAAK